MIAQLSVFISQVTPLSGHASVHVVKAIYEQWPDMKPRLLWLCKQPHLFEPTCSPAFTSLINNEISLGYYYDCIRNIAVATLLQKVCTNARYSFKTMWFSSCTSYASDPCSFISAIFFYYLYSSLFVFISVSWTLPPMERRAGSKWSLSLTFTGGSLIIPDWRDMAAIMKCPQVEHRDTYCIVPQWIYIFSNKRKM